jgi:hypothetical protein
MIGAGDLLIGVSATSERLEINQEKIKKKGGFL